MTLWFLLHQALLDGERAATFLTTETRNPLLIGTVTEITGRYYELAADLVSLVSADKPNSSFILVINFERFSPPPPPLYLSMCVLFLQCRSWAG